MLQNPQHETNSNSSIAQLQKLFDASPAVTNLANQFKAMNNQGTSAIIQPVASGDEEELLPKQFEPVQRVKNSTGLPDNLKNGVESLSGQSLDNVSVHYNSNKPAQLNALAYAQGDNIHIGPGQEKHLLHETWHVAQQKQGRVKPTSQQQKTAINSDPALEKEADVMGAKAILTGNQFPIQNKIQSISRAQYPVSQVMQLCGIGKDKPGFATYAGAVNRLILLILSVYELYHQANQLDEDGNPNYAALLIRISVVLSEINSTINYMRDYILQNGGSKGHNNVGIWELIQHAFLLFVSGYDFGEEVIVEGGENLRRTLFSVYTLIMSLYEMWSGLVHYKKRIDSDKSKRDDDFGGDDDSDDSLLPV
ncbi:MAG: DUF4157 domain-containing protein [Magnetococcales bacterium]|nr:DUF4157 domain-containing protein [Magnetococcales bacterium]